MKRGVKNLIRQLLRATGYDVVRYTPPQPVLPSPKFPPDYDEEIINTILSVKPYTMTSTESIFSLCVAVRYIVENEIPGDVVECGVWKGGSIMAVARTLLQCGDTSRHLYLFDTFEGMTEPGEQDVRYDGMKPLTKWRELRRDDGGSNYCYASLEEVQEAVNSVGYDIAKIHCVQGRVEDTIPAKAPQEIALLRLDTDWYESTRHELQHLFPRLARGGIIIIDDYGYWGGVRQATDEYLQEHGINLFLNRIDWAGRIGVKI